MSIWLQKEVVSKIEDYRSPNGKYSTQTIKGEKKMKKSVYPLISILMLVSIALSACGSPATPAPATQVPATAAPATAIPPTAVPPTAVPPKPLHFIYVTPSTESDYWGKYILTGIQNAVLDIKTKYGVDVTLDVQGPAAEASQDQYMTILESVIASKPDGILLGNLNPDAVTPLVKQATAAGIRVDLISIGDNNTRADRGPLYYCDQPQQGELAAQAFFDALKAKNLPLDGVVGVHMSVVVPVLEAKLQKFRDTLHTLAPNLNILETQYNQNDVHNGISLMENQLATYGDKLVGFFGGNNVTGDAIVNVIDTSGKKGKLVGVAVDSDPAEIQGMGNGLLDALIVQTPYDQAYGATMDVAKYLIEGDNSAPDMVNIPGVVITPANMNSDASKALLDPTLLKK
jgi:ribose transport system substrate-binding protein